ncbi:MAG: DUF6470 family protein [Oscillospiraceae bacterium]|nr:DUF6470 family protein [Oscillospiraceae bacterium]
MLPKIVIRTETGSFSINSQMAKLSVRPARYELSMDGNAGERIRIQSEQGQLKVDSTEFFASMGKTPPMRQNGEYSAAAMQKGISRIGNIAREGLQFLRIEQNGNAIPAVAASKKRPDVKLDIKPTKPPEVSFKPGTLRIKADTMNFDSSWEYVEGSSEYVPHEVVIEFTPTSIEITLEPGVELNFPVSDGLGVSVDSAV